MHIHKKKVIRDILRFFGSLIFFWLYIPHIVLFFFGKQRSIIRADILQISGQVCIPLPLPLMFLYLVHNNCYFRNVFIIELDLGSHC